MSLRALWMVALLSACGGNKGEAGGGEGGAADSGGGDGAGDCDTASDADCDGWTDEEDCRPTEPWSYPGADEIPYDGVDNDCAGDGDLVDVDGDGHDGESAGGDDCNDNNSAVFPGAEEICYDGLDSDCDGVPVSAEAEGNDCDGDGHDGRGEEATDCDDEDPSVHEGAVETWYDGVDSDCTGPGSSDYDADLDGDDHVDHGGLDCDDSNPGVSGAMNEALDGVDQDCSGVIDDLDTFDATANVTGIATSGDGWFGKALARLPDLDADGQSELVVGAPWHSSSGTELGCDPSTGSIAPCGGALHRLSGEVPDGTVEEVSLAVLAGNDDESQGDWLGFDLALLGDLDGDGLPELAAGAPLRASGVRTGAALVYSGAALGEAGDLGALSAHATVLGPDYLGLELAAAPDLDGDGLPELIASSSDGYIGALNGLQLWAGIFSSTQLAAGGELTGAAAWATLQGGSAGGELLPGLDLDGDGLAELVVGMDTDGDGGAAVFSGELLVEGAALTLADAATLTAGSASWAGWKLGALEDVNGDGSGELVLACAACDVGELEDAGVVYLLPGPLAAAGGDATTLAQASISNDLDAYTYLQPVAQHSGDVDGDGLPELLLAELGGSGEHAIDGEAYLMDGADLTLGGAWLTSGAVAQVDSRNSDEMIGMAGLVVDFDGDGLADLLIGAPAASDAGTLYFYASAW